MCVLAQYQGGKMLVIVVAHHFKNGDKTIYKLDPFNMKEQMGSRHQNIYFLTQRPLISIYVCCLLEPEFGGKHDIVKQTNMDQSS